MLKSATCIFKCFRARIWIAVGHSGIKWDAGSSGACLLMEILEHMFLTGEYHHTFDDKYRLTVPSKYREEFVDGIYVGRGFDRNLMVLTAACI